MSSNPMYSKIIYAKTLAIYIFIYILGGVSLSAYVGGHMKSVFIVVLGFLVFVIAPAVFRKRFQEVFERNASFFFEKEFLRIEISKNNSNIIEYSNNINYKSIVSCLISSSSPKSSTIKVALIDSSSFQYSFLSEEKVFSSDKQNDVNTALQLFNELRQINKEIYLEKPFFVSEYGKFFIYILCILVFLALIISAIYKPILIPLSILPLLLITLQIFMRRSRDILTYNRYKDVEK